MLSEFEKDTLEKYYVSKQFTNSLSKSAYERSIGRFIDFTEHYKITHLDFQKPALDKLLDKFVYYLENEAERVYAASTINFSLIIF